MKLDSTTTMWLVRACVVDWRDLICSFIPFIRIIRVFRVGTSFPLFFYPKGSAFSCVYCVFHKNTDSYSVVERPCGRQIRTAGR